MFFEGWKAEPEKPKPQPISPYEYVVPVPEGSDDEKRAYAEALLRQPDNPMAAAVAVFGGQRGSHCFHVSITWPGRDDVKQYMRELLDERGPGAFVPDKYTVAREVIGIARDRYTVSDVALKAYKLYSEILDFNPKNVEGNKQVNVGVMVVNSHGDNDQWEKELASQQAKLIVDATANSK